MYEELVKRLRQLADEQMFEFERTPYKQAADAIEELTAVAESYKRSMEVWADTAGKAVEQIPRWIPVMERLPEPYFDVLFTDGGSVGIASYQKKGGYWLGSDVFYDAHVAVTHWMPLPEPPKEVAK